MTASVIGNGPGGRPRTRQARIAGPSRLIDRRVNAIRSDLADARLADVAIAPRYAEGVFQRCDVMVATLRSAPAAGAVAVSELLFGEAFAVFDVVSGDGGRWAWGQCLHDGYVGWVCADALGAMGRAASHSVAVPAATVFAAADIKSPVVRTLPLNARLAVDAVAGDFVAVHGGFLSARHVAPIGATSGDPVALALGFVGTPYVWGGRTRDGIDCSGLTQAVLGAAGVFCPRDSDQQAAAFARIDPAARRRGDLVTFPGHVGILADADTLIHANAHWMATVVEPLAAVVARLAASGIHRPPLTAASPCSAG